MPHIQFLFFFSYNSVAPRNQLLEFLRFCATGSHLPLVGDYSGMHIATVSLIIKRVATVIAYLANRFIIVPRKRLEREQQWLQFYEKARVIGVHIRIQSPVCNFFILPLCLIL